MREGESEIERGERGEEREGEIQREEWIEKMKRLYLAPLDINCPISSME